MSPAEDPTRAEGALARAVGVAERIVRSGVGAGEFPCAVVGIATGDGVPVFAAAGRLSDGATAPEATAATIFDLASLTKVIATTSVAMRLVDENQLDLQAAVGKLLPVGGEIAAVRLDQLLTHSAGLPAHLPLYLELTGLEAFLDQISQVRLEYAPGTRSVYSDLGFILLGAALQVLGQQPLDRLVRRVVTDPLGLQDCCFLPQAEVAGRIAPTEVCPWRGRLLCGEVHDENAAALGGVAGHAGLFGTARDLMRFSQAVLRDLRGDRARLATRETLTRFVRRSGIPESTRALGWDTPVAAEDAERSSTPGEKAYASAGSLFSAASFGHTGFTGTSLWLDPTRDLAVTLLTNRVHPTRGRGAEGIKRVRAELADAVVRALERP